MEEDDDAVATIWIAYRIRLCASLGKMQTKRVVWQTVLHNSVVRMNYCVIQHRYIHQYHTITILSIGYRCVSSFRCGESMSIPHQRQIIGTNCGIQGAERTFANGKP